MNIFLSLLYVARYWSSRFFRETILVMVFSLNHTCLWYPGNFALCDAIMVPPFLLRRIVDFDQLIFLTRERLQKISIVDWLFKRIISLRSSWEVSLFFEICLKSCDIQGSKSASSCANWKLCLPTLLSEYWKWESSSVSESDRLELLYFSFAIWVFTEWKVFFIVLIYFSSFFTIQLEEALVLDLLSSSSFKLLLEQCEYGRPFLW